MKIKVIPIAVHKSLNRSITLRPIVGVVIEQEGQSVVRQPFYRSSGRNSNKPGEWLPFMGIERGSGWFIKRCVNPANPDLQCSTSWPEDKDHSLYRYGYVQYKQISRELGRRDIPDGPIMDEGPEIANRIEEFLKGNMS